MTVAQMKARCTLAHKAGLRNVAAVGRANAPGRPRCGAQAMDTLIRWGCVTIGPAPEYRAALTATGELLLAQVDA